MKHNITITAINKERTTSSIGNGMEKYDVYFDFDKEPSHLWSYNFCRIIRDDVMLKNLNIGSCMITLWSQYKTSVWHDTTIDDVNKKQLSELASIVAKANEFTNAGSDFTKQENTDETKKRVEYVSRVIDEINKSSKDV